MLTDYDKNWCNKLLSDLGKMPIANPFKNPVDTVHEAPTYLDIVKHPMDFSTMKKKLQNNEYPDVQSFIDDIQLICDNAKKFNGEDSLFGMIGNDIMDEVHKVYSEKCSNAEEEWFKSLHKAVSKLENHTHNAPPEISFIQETTPCPNMETTELDDDQIKKIETLIGEKLENLEEKWFFLNQETRVKVLNIVNNQDNDEEKENKQENESENQSEKDD